MANILFTACKKTFNNDKSVLKALKQHENMWDIPGLFFMDESTCFYEHREPYTEFSHQQLVDIVNTRLFPESRNVYVMRVKGNTSEFGRIRVNATIIGK